MKCLIIIILMVVLTGCGTKRGSCVELTDGSGRVGVYIMYKGYAQIRMIDTGNVELKKSYEYILVDRKLCD